MSCHDIGRGLNNVVENILPLIDEGKISFADGKKLIRVCRDSVHYCDGNRDEALVCLEKQSRCSSCLRVVDKSQIINCFAVPEDFGYMKDLLRKMSYEEDILGGYVCKPCAEKLYRGTHPEK